MAIESNLGEVSGLGLADFKTVLTEQKQLTRVTATSLFSETRAQVNGYEIHCGRSEGKALSHPAFTFTLDEEKYNDGFVSQDKAVIGTYLHGLFDSAEMCQAILDWVRPDQKVSKQIDINEHRELQLNKLAQVCNDHLDIEKIQQILEQGNE